MKKICIIGWYGTETIGDRAILAGLISFLGQTYGEFELNLGALYPEYSKRMVGEDKDLYKKILGHELKIELFDSKNKKELKNKIKESDLVAMGGGPIMHITPLYMVAFAFKYAKKLNRKTGLLGCGIGPLFSNKFKKIALNIVKNSDIIVLRDKKSKENLIEISKQLNFNLNESKIKVSFDPAVECALKFLRDKKYKNKDKKYIAINLRDFPAEYAKEEIKEKINFNLINFIEKISEKFNDTEIRLIPMHYYHIGTDDREFLNTIVLEKKLNNVKVQNRILTLEETMESFTDAFFNVGMRFHSVVLQTILSGKNYILDYTEPKKGKISGFINDVDMNGFYSKRFINIQENINNLIDVENLIINENEKFNYNLEKTKESLKIYVKELNKLKKEV